MTTKSLMQVSTEAEANAYEAWSKDSMPRLFGDVSSAEFTQRNKEFLEFGGRVDVAVGKHSELTAHDKLLAARKASQLVEALSVAKTAPTAQVNEAKKPSGLTFFGLFGKLGLKSKRKETPVLSENMTIKRSKKQ